MRELINEDKQEVSGGTQYLNITSKVEFEGIPENCVFDFYNANKENVTNFNMDTLGHDIIQQCAAFKDVLNYSFGTDTQLLSVALVEI